MQENQNTGRMDTQHLGNVEIQNPNPATNLSQTQRQPSPNRRPTNSGSRPPQRRRKK